MHSFDTAHSFVASPIIRKISQTRIKAGGITINTGLDRSRAREILLNEGDGAKLDEVARLAALFGLELSIVPDTLGDRAFTEVERHLATTFPMSCYAKRVVDMVEKLGDFCVDVRLATELSASDFDRKYSPAPDFMSRVCDFGSTGDITLNELHAFVADFGATIATFPNVSPFSNYYRALASINDPSFCYPASTSLKVA